jgi:glycosyltransferase involved in cell wall biosynthesis
MIPLVSFIIAAYRSNEEYLTATIASALGQTSVPIEVIVTDDSASDVVRKVASSFCDARVKYFSNPTPQGPATNHSIGFRLATGKYLAILNHDDVVDKNFLTYLVPPLEQNPLAVLSFCDHHVIDANGRVLETETEANSRFWGRNRLVGGSYRPFDELLVNQSIPMAMGAVFRKAALSGDLPMEAGPAYDFWLTYLLCKTRGAAYYVPKRLSSWRAHSGSLTSQRGLEWILGSALCWVAVSHSPELRSIRPTARSRAGEAYASCAIVSWQLGKTGEARTFGRTALSLTQSFRTFASYFLSITPRAFASKKYGRPS